MQDFIERLQEADSIILDIITKSDFGIYLIKIDYLKKILNISKHNTKKLLKELKSREYYKYFDYERGNGEFLEIRTKIKNTN